MDSPFLPLAIVVVILIAVGAYWLLRAARSTSMSAGSRLAERTQRARLDDILDELGGTLVVHASEPAVRELVDGVILDGRRHYLPLDDGGYGIRFLQPDDTRVALLEDRDGIRLQIERFREYMGMPQTAPTWTALREQITAAAQTSGITVSKGPRAMHSRGRHLEGDDAEWLLADGPDRG